MKHPLHLAALSILLVFTGSMNAKAFEPTDTVIPETQAQKDARMEWWRDARLGMFIHWGAYSVPAGVHDGKNYKGLAEWIMLSAKIPVPEYEKYAKQFNPQRYDAERWVKLAKEAGFKYIVITSKHHDGFALWDSKVSDYDTVDFTPYKKDLLKPLAEACRKHGIKFCLYYSIMDWHHPLANREEWDKHSKNPNKQWVKYRDEYMIPQLKELLTEYGDVGVLWFDGEWIEDWTESEGKALYNRLREIQPNLIINNRVGKGRKGYQGMNKDDSYVGDFGTPEQQIPDKGMPGYDWETCMTMNDSWGYSSIDHNWKSREELIRQLIDTSSKGGNFLLNVGPTAEGLIPEPSVERLKAIGDWMRLHSEAIYGSDPSPFNIPEWGRYTHKPGKLYAHVFEWPEDGKLAIHTGDFKIDKVYLLADSKQTALASHLDGQTTTVDLPKQAPSPVASVLVLEYKK